VATAAARRSGADQIQQKWRRRRARRESKDRTRQNYKKRVQARERAWRPIRVHCVVPPCHFSLPGKRIRGTCDATLVPELLYCNLFFALLITAYGWAVG